MEKALVRNVLKTEIVNNLDRYDLISQMILRSCCFNTLVRVGQIIGKTTRIDKYWGNGKMDTFQLNIVMIMVGLFRHFFELNEHYINYLNMKIRKKYRYEENILYILSICLCYQSVYYNCAIYMYQMRC